MKKLSIALAVGLVFSAPALADEECNIGDQVVKNLQAKLANVVNLPDANGGLFNPIECGQPWSIVKAPSAPSYVAIQMRGLAAVQ
jgi:hypothetical protein